MFVGIVNIRKEKGFTSHDVVNIVRKLTKSKAGHTGTLDPNAVGVLPVCLGRATKIADYIMAGDKEYVAEVVFGTATDTLDSTGKIIAQGGRLPDLTEIESALASFVGKIEQVPPMYSAIKIGGKKLYEYARAGAEVELKPRGVEIFSVEILEAKLPGSVKFRVNCSKGTYIRSLCADLGEKLSTYAHMGELVRTKSGSFCLDDSISLGRLEELFKAGQLDGALLRIEDALAHLPRLFIDPGADKLLKNGNKIPLTYVSELEGQSNSEYLGFDADGTLAGIFTCVGEHIKPKVMLCTT